MQKVGSSYGKGLTGRDGTIAIDQLTIAAPQPQHNCETRPNPIRKLFAK